MPRCWEIVGGGDKGGILVRAGVKLDSARETARLSTGAIVIELQFTTSGRLKYELVSGTGPRVGWISAKLDGKVLASPLDMSISTQAQSVDCEPQELFEARKQRSEEALRKRFAGEKVLVKDNKAPREFVKDVIKRMHAGEIPGFRKLTAVEIEKNCKDNLPGIITGLKFPHSAKQIEEFGASWLTEALHKYKTLPADNSVKKLVSVEPLMLSGFNAAGGAGPKAFITVEYEKPDPNLHTHLFAKLPWDPHAPPGTYPGVPSDTAAFYRKAASGADGEGPEIYAALLLETAFPFTIPKLYFGDINRDTTNFIHIYGRIAFGPQPDHQNGKVIKHYERKPFEILPVQGKYQDFLADDPHAIYTQILRSMGALGGFDHQGAFDFLLGPITKFGPDDWLKHNTPRPKRTPKAFEVKQRGMSHWVDPAVNFVANVAPQLFSAEAKDATTLESYKSMMSSLGPYMDDIQGYLGNTSDHIAAMHGNLQTDNAFFWRDEDGNLDSGLLDWGGFSRRPYIMAFLGVRCPPELNVNGAEALMKCFCDEFERHGGPHLDWEEVLRKYRLVLIIGLADCSQWVEKDMLREIPANSGEWEKMPDRFCDAFWSRWNARNRGTTLIYMMELWARMGPFLESFWKDWLQNHQAYLTTY